jgi:hypothetical protein
LRGFAFEYGEPSPLVPLDLRPCDPDVPEVVVCVPGRRASVKEPVALLTQVHEKELAWVVTSNPFRPPNGS